MSTESLHRTSEVVETPSQYFEAPKRVHEFLAAAMMHHNRRKKPVTLRNAFAIFDKDGSGQISKSELQDLVGEARDS